MRITEKRLDDLAKTACGVGLNVRTDYAYGQVRIVEARESGAIMELSGFGTMKEAWAFLSGMLATISYQNRHKPAPKNTLAGQLGGPIQYPACRLLKMQMHSYEPFVASVVTEDGTVVYMLKADQEDGIVPEVTAGFILSPTDVDNLLLYLKRMGIVGPLCHIQAPVFQGAVPIPEVAG